MKEIGGYLELDTYGLPMLHEGAIALNTARNCLAYIIRKRNIKRIFVPKLLCASVANTCEREGIETVFYSIGIDFKPVGIECIEDDWVYIVNYYDQLSDKDILGLLKKYKNIIVDNVQAYFHFPIEGVDTIYTCRKFLGVTDGAFLYSDIGMDERLEQDESFDRMGYLLGRFERSASEFYSNYTKREEILDNLPVRRMSKLTNNLLHGINYEYIKKQRTSNFELLHSEMSHINQLRLTIPEGPYMYPLYIQNGAEIRKQLQQKRIYIPTLWLDVFEWCDKCDLEYDMADNILPLPIDQRYSEEDMQYIIQTIKNIFNNGVRDT